MVQCRLNKTSKDLYTDILGQLGLQIIVEQSKESVKKGRLEAAQEIGINIIAKLLMKQEFSLEKKDNIKSIPVGNNLDDLKFISEVILASDRRIVIEDFHYLSPTERQNFSFDLKALWDYGVYIVIIGIWADNNLLIHLNPDLAGRIEEFLVSWKPEKLKSVVTKGSVALNICIDQKTINKVIEDSFGTVGVLQKLILLTLDNAKIEKSQNSLEALTLVEQYEAAAMHYADQLNALYQTFATRTARGIRQRKNSTGIYAVMLKVVMESNDQKLISGISIDELFKLAHGVESRVQKPNLRQILLKIDGIQVDEHGRGLVITFDEHKDEVSVVDRRVLFYRKYSTTKWPWENIINEEKSENLGFDSDDEE